LFDPLKADEILGSHEKINETCDRSSSKSFNGSLWLKHHNRGFPWEEMAEEIVNCVVHTDTCHCIEKP